MTTSRVLLVLACACGSPEEKRASGGSAATVPAATVVAADATPRVAFVRVAADQARGASYMRAARGERVGNMAIVGDFLCRLEAQFGPPDPFVDLFHDATPHVAFPLRHVASGQVVVPYPEGFGFAGFEESAPWTAAVDELDALLAATTPRDCEHTFAGSIRVNRAGVRDGKPFFVHLPFAETLDHRLAQLAHNDEHGGERKARVERELCGALQQNWLERRDASWQNRKAPIDPEKARYARRDEVLRRLRGCLEAELRDLEEQVAQDWFDHDAVPEQVAAAFEAFEDIEADIDEPGLRQRVQQLRATTKRKAAALRRR